MNTIGKSERVTQERVKALFQKLDYTFLGDWTDRDNRPIEEVLLRTWLTKRGHSTVQINRALDLLGQQANHVTRSLMDTNQAVYGLLRYGVKVKTSAEANTETIWLIDWENPDKNDFSIAEEVTLRGANERRPDLVLYLNGLAVAVIELKRSAVSIGEGIRQLISNQQPAFNAWFFSTVQMVMAGNDTEGLRYGTIGTPETFFLPWKEDEADNSGYRLDKYLRKMCEKKRFIELLRDFVLFDGGIKKRISTLASRRPRPASWPARAASSGTRRARVKASSWCCWRGGFWRIGRKLEW
jgi:type I restriction enzyme, R subunit